MCSDTGQFMYVEPEEERGTEKKVATMDEVINMSNLLEAQKDKQEDELWMKSSADSGSVKHISAIHTFH